MPPAPGSAPTPRARRSALHGALLALAVCMVVAVAVPGYGLLLPGADGAWVRPVAAAAVVLGALGLLRMRRQTPRRSRHEADPTFAAFASAATLMVLLATVAYVAPRAAIPDLPVPARPASDYDPSDSQSERSERSRPPLAEPPSGGGFDRRGTGARSGNRSVVPGNPLELPGISNMAFRSSWATTLLVLLLVVIAIIAFLNRRGAPFQKWHWVPAGEDGPEPPLDPARAQEGIQASLGAMDYAGGDPRRQIAAAYHRLLAALADAGAARAPQEAPFEYLARVLEPLGVPRAPLHRLTELYVLAQFSRRPVAAGHRDAAVAALREALASLPERAPATLPAAGGEPDDGGAPPGGHGGPRHVTLRGGPRG